MNKITNKFNDILKILFIIILLVLILFSSSSCCGLLRDYYSSIEDNQENNTGGGFLDEYNNTTENNQENNTSERYSDIKKELYDTTGYYISPEEEEEFYENLKENYDGENIEKVIDGVKILKNFYPKGFFIVIKTAPLDNFSFSNIIFSGMSADLESGNLFESDIFINDIFSSLNILVHEYTHLGCLYRNLFDINEKGYFYLMGNFGVFIKKDKELFEKTELYKDISNPDDFDLLYISPGFGKSGIDFMVILDELNAYTISTEIEIALEEMVPESSCNDTRYGLLKQMSYLELYLKKAYKEHPKDWEYIISNKGLSFLIMKLWQEASRFEQTIKDDHRFSLKEDPVAEFVYNDENFSIIEKLFNDSGVIEYKEKDFDEVSFDELTIYEIK